MQPHVQPNAGGAESHWVIRFESFEALLDTYDQALIHGALFVPTETALPAGAGAHVELDLAFSGTRVPLEAMVVATRPRGADAPPGISLKIAGSPDALRLQLEMAACASLPEANTATPVGLVRRAPRFETRATVDIECQGQRYVCETANMSTNGVLLLVRRCALSAGTWLDLRIDAPGSGEPLVIQGRVSNHTRCYGGVMALGVQFLYPLSRFDEVSRFVDDLRSHHHAYALASVSGSLEHTSLSDVLENFANAATVGTLCIRRGDQTGKIAFSEGQIVHASAGLATGPPAITRLLGWQDAQFELRPELEPADTAQPTMTVQAALLSAAVERDELSLHGAAQLDPETVFTLDRKRLRALARGLDDFAHELAENAALGIPLAALIDFIDAGDTRFYRTLSELVDGGVLHVVDDDSTLPLVVAR